MTISQKIHKPLSHDDNLLQSDLDYISKLVREAGVFNEEEIRVARELAEDSLNGHDLTYKFLFFRDESGEPMAYTCYGEIPLTEKRFDLYWIVVSPKVQGQGVGKKIMEATEERIAALDGKHIYAETSSTDHYIPARKLYLKHGFIEACVVKDFYRNGDDKVLYQKHVGK